MSGRSEDQEERCLVVVFFGREGEGEAGPVTGGESQEGAGVEEGVAGPGDEGRRIKRPRKSATCLRVCSLDTLQSTGWSGRLHAHHVG